MNIKEIRTSSQAVAARYGTLRQVGSATINARIAGFRVPWIRATLERDEAVNIAEKTSVIDERRAFPRFAVEGRTLRKDRDVWARSTRSPEGKWFSGPHPRPQGIDWDQVMQLQSTDPYSETLFGQQTTVHRFDVMLPLEAMGDAPPMPPIFSLAPPSGHVAYRIDDEGLICSMSSVLSISIGLAQFHRSLERRELEDRLQQWAEEHGDADDEDLFDFENMDPGLMDELLNKVMAGAGSFGLDLTTVSQVRDLGLPVEEVSFPSPASCIASKDPVRDAFRSSGTGRDAGLDF